MARRATHSGDLVCRLRRDRLLNRRIDLANHPHHRPRDVLRWLHVTGEIVHRIVRAHEHVTVNAGDAERGGKILHRLEQLRPGHVLREHLQILWRWLRRATAVASPLTLALWCLRRCHKRPRQNEDADGGCPERVTIHANPPDQSKRCFETGANCNAEVGLAPRVGQVAARCSHRAKRGPTIRRMAPPTRNVGPSYNHTR